VKVPALLNVGELDPLSRVWSAPGTVLLITEDAFVLVQVNVIGLPTSTVVTLGVRVTVGRELRALTVT
jgi:hypothetical protein